MATIPFALNSRMSRKSVEQMRLGALGFVKGLDIAPDRTLLASCDTYGGFRYDWSANLWTNIVTYKSRGKTFDHLMSCWSLVSAHSLTSRYAAWLATAVSGTYVLCLSDDSGASWTETSLSFSGWNAPGNDYVNATNNLAFDPINPSVLYAGIQTASGTVGCYRCENAHAGANAVFTKVSALDPTDLPGVTAIVFDQSGGTTTVNGQTVTKNILFAVRGRGVYRSTNGGSSFSLIGSSPTLVWSGQNIDTGTYAGTTWFTCDTLQAKAYSYDSVNGFAQLLYPASTANSGAAVPGICAVNKNSGQSGDVVFISSTVGYETARTFANGTTFLTWDNPGYKPAQTDATFFVNTSIGMPALAIADPGGSGQILNIANAVRDPNNNDAVIAATGIGVAYFVNPTLGSHFFDARVYDFSINPGIEQLVAYDIVTVPGGSVPICSVADRCTISPSTNNQYATTYYPGAYQFGNSTACDFASSDPSFVVCNAYANFANQMGKSTNYGVTFTSLSAQPNSGANGGSGIAVSTPSNFITVLTHGSLEYTMDGGATWNTATGINNANWNTGLINSFNALVADPDPASPGVFCAYVPSVGMYRSADGGASWTLVHAALTGDTDLYNFDIRKMMGVPHTIIISIGGKLYVSPDMGTTITQISAVSSSFQAGVGKIAPGQTTPRVFVYATISGVLGASYSDDILAGTPHWTLILTDTDFRQKYTGDELRCSAGDWNDHRVYYLGTSGSGYQILRTAA